MADRDATDCAISLPPRKYQLLKPQTKAPSFLFSNSLHNPHVCFYVNIKELLLTTTAVGQMSMVKEHNACDVHMWTRYLGYQILFGL